MGRLAIIAAVVFTPGMALAHPDHVSPDRFGASHYLTDPFHLAMAGMSVLLVVGLRRLALRRQEVRN